MKNNLTKVMWGILLIMLCFVAFSKVEVMAAEQVLSIAEVGAFDISSLALNVGETKKIAFTAYGNGIMIGIYSDYYNFSYERTGNKEYVFYIDGKKAGATSIYARVGETKLICPINITDSGVLATDTPEPKGTDIRCDVSSVSMKVGEIKNITFSNFSDIRSANINWGYNVNLLDVTYAKNVSENSITFTLRGKDSGVTEFIFECNGVSYAIPVNVGSGTITTTATPKPTITSKPKVTPKPSTTPKPTVTKKPTSTPKPSVTPANMVYFDKDKLVIVKGKSESVNFFSRSTIVKSNVSFTYDRACISLAQIGWNDTMIYINVSGLEVGYTSLRVEYDGNWAEIPVTIVNDSGTTTPIPTTAPTATPTRRPTATPTIKPTATPTNKPTPTTVPVGTHYDGSLFNDDKKALSKTDGRYYTDQEWLLYEAELKARVERAGLGTRAAAVEAALYLCSLPYAVPYRGTPMDRPHNQGVYPYKGLNREWGVFVKLYQDVGNYKKGDVFMNGVDCTGFVAWVMVNAGFENEGFQGYASPGSYGGNNSKLKALNTYRNEVQPGDFIFTWDNEAKKTDHIGFVVGVETDYIYVAECGGAGVYKTKVTKCSKNNNTARNWKFYPAADYYMNKSSAAKNSNGTENKGNMPTVNWSTKVSTKIW